MVVMSFKVGVISVLYLGGDPVCVFLGEGQDQKKKKKKKKKTHRINQQGCGCALQCELTSWVGRVQIQVVVGEQERGGLLI
jgi:hypothetical protein